VHLMDSLVVLALLGAAVWSFYVSFRQTCAGRKMVMAGGGWRFRGRRVDGGEGEAIGAADADGRQSLSGIRLGFTSSDAGSTGVRMAPDGSPGFTGEVEL